jgi:hypothetical protein
MPVPAIGVAGLVLIFAIGTLRPINLGVLALVLTGVTYLFGVAVRKGTVEWIVDVSVGRTSGRRAGLDGRGAERTKAIFRRARSY